MYAGHLKKVSKEEFNAFLDEYNKEKAIDINRVYLCDPVRVQFRDMKLYHKESVEGLDEYLEFYHKTEIARIVERYQGPNGEYDETGKFYTYWIREKEDHDYELENKYRSSFGYMEGLEDY